VAGVGLKWEELAPPDPATLRGPMESLSRPAVTILTIVVLVLIVKIVYDWLETHR
jgi:hypothetical protein